MRFLFGLCAVGLAFAPSLVRAAACSGCTNPRLQNNLGLGQKNPQAGELTLSFSLAGTRTHASHAVDVEQFEPNHDPNVPGQHAHVQAATHDLDFQLANISLGLAYAFSASSSVSFQLPLRRVDVEARFLDDNDAVMAGFSSIHHRTERIEGIGDLELGFTHLLLRPTARIPISLLLNGGLTLPTGNTVEDPFDLGRKGQTHQHIFFGSGTADPFLGLAMAYNKTTWGAASYLRLRHALYENSYGYNGGSQMTAGFSAGSGFGLKGFNLRASAEIYWERPARWGGELAKNSGRTDLIPGLSMAYTVNEQLTVFAMLRRPITLAVSGGQLDLSVHGLLGLRWAWARNSP